ncbi:MAG TPA: hypothetical protein VM784_01990 [Actinomycetota bacterium]|nr:hypothetical protein [Actinomycetota bacterium]
MEQGGEGTSYRRRPSVGSGPATSCGSAKSILQGDRVVDLFDVKLWIQGDDASGVQAALVAQRRAETLSGCGSHAQRARRPSPTAR